MEDRTTHVGVRIPNDVVERIDEKAAREDRTRSNLIVHLLRKALRQEEVERVRAE